MPGGSAVTGRMVSHYDLVEILERGESGPVYRARDGRDGSMVAVEMLPSVSPAALQRLRRDAETAAGLRHPHIAPVLEVGSDSSSTFVVRALEGETLCSRLARGPLAPDHAVGLASQIAAALGRAHEAGLVHRDLRPGSIFLTADGQARVGGFGFVWVAPAAPAYRSPELLRAASPDDVDARTDIWSLGAILYQMVTGRRPFPDPGRLEPMEIPEPGPEPMSSIQPDLPPELDELVVRALAGSPAARPARMDDFLVSLRAILAGGDLREVDSTVVQVPGVRGMGGAGRAEPEPAASSASSMSSDRQGGGAPSEGMAVAHYRILELIGVGSMGTVYRAEDTRLRRMVALKFLPGELALDPQAKARFFQEARAASALDHANICTIHEVGETGDGHLYIAMASYDGETVRQRLVPGRLPVAEAVEIARQTAAGLAISHRGGIVHRDIKPANLIVTADGVVKILDFGVAKLRGAAGGAGSFLGSPAYMSPEQARGEEVDRRADVWSLGVVLYEMLAGARPFKGGDDLAAVFRSLLEDRPEPLSRVRPEVGPALEKIVMRMLARSPEARYASADEVAADLAALQTSAPVSRRVWGWAAVLAAASLALGGWLALRPSTGAVPPGAIVRPAFSSLTDEEGSELYPSLAPDGKSFVYVKAVDGQMDIFLRKREERRSPVNLTAGSPVDDTQPAFSPKGEWLAFRSERDGGGVFVMPVPKAGKAVGATAGEGGGEARRVSDFGFNPAWSPNGQEIAVATEGVIGPSIRTSESKIWIVDLSTGLKRRVVEDDGVQPSWSPDGSRIAYWSVPAGGSQRSLWSVPAEGGAPSRLLEDEFSNWNPIWSPDGNWLYFGSDRSGGLNLWQVPVDQKAGKVRGKPLPVTIPAAASGFWGLSSDGRQMIYAADERKSNVESFPFDPVTLRVTSGVETEVTSGSHRVFSAAVSPDGTQVAFHEVMPREDLFVVRADGTGQRQLTNDSFNDRQPFWSPDGRQLLFYSDRGGIYEAWVIPAAADRPEPERILPKGADALTFPIWSPDGRRVACTLMAGGGAIVDLVPPFAERRLQPLPSSDPFEENFSPSSWSPDGGRIAGNVIKVDRSVEEGIGVFSLASRTYERWTTRGRNPYWLRDGHRVLYTEDGIIMVFDTRTEEAQRVLAPPSSSAYLSVSTGPGDRTLFTVRAVDEGDIQLLTWGGGN